MSTLAFYGLGQLYLLSHSAWLKSHNWARSMPADVLNFRSTKANNGKLFPVDKDGKQTSDEPVDARGNKLVEGEVPKTRTRASCTDPWDDGDNPKGYACVANKNEMIEKRKAFYANTLDHEKQKIAQPNERGGSMVECELPGNVQIPPGTEYVIDLSTMSKYATRDGFAKYVNCCLSCNCIRFRG